MGLRKSPPENRLLLLVFLFLLCATGGCNRGSWTLWDSYSARFIDVNGRVFDLKGDRHTTSEGQAYALFFALADNWRQTALNIPRLLEQTSRHGYAMDWAEYLPGDGFYPVAQKKPGSKDSDGAGGVYDAIRVYLSAGMVDGSGEKRTELLNAVPAMSAYLADHDAPPEKISDQGIPLAQDGPVGFSAAVPPYLRTLPGNSRLVGRQIIRLNLMKDKSTGMYGKDLSYFDQNLSLFATGFLAGRFGFGPGGELKVEWSRR
jgi:endoglucanase